MFVPMGIFSASQTVDPAQCMLPALAILLKNCTVLISLTALGLHQFPRLSVRMHAAGFIPSSLRCLSQVLPLGIAIYQGSGGPIPGNIQDQVGQGSEQSDLVSGVPAPCGGVGLDDLWRSLSTQNFLWFYSMIPYSSYSSSNSSNTTNKVRSPQYTAIVAWYTVSHAILTSRTPRYSFSHQALVFATLDNNISQVSLHNPFSFPGKTFINKKHAHDDSRFQRVFSNKPAKP